MISGSCTKSITSITCHQTPSEPIPINFSGFGARPRINMKYWKRCLKTAAILGALPVKHHLNAWMIYPAQQSAASLLGHWLSEEVSVGDSDKDKYIWGVTIWSKALTGLLPASKSWLWTDANVHSGLKYELGIYSAPKPKLRRFAV